MKNIRFLFLLLALVATLLVAGCTQQQTQLAPPAPAPTLQPTALPTALPTVLPTASFMNAPPVPGISTAGSAFGTILVDSRGRTIYYYTNDNPGSGTSACSGQCAATWPAVWADTSAVASTLDPALFAYITRSDGSRQSTYQGRPLYTYSGDAGPGDVNGQGISGFWYVATIPGTVPTVVTGQTVPPTPTPQSGGNTSGHASGDSGGYGGVY